MENISEDQIREKAKEIWNRKGRPVGYDDQVWREAKQELWHETDYTEEGLYKDW